VIKDTQITIYLDCTRLLRTSQSLRPTGICRVDINFLYSIITDQEFYPLGFVESVLADEVTNVFFEISHEKTRTLIAICYEKWINGSPNDELYIEAIQAILKDVGDEAKAAAVEFGKTQQIDSRILQRTNQNKVTPKYLNTTFVNIPLGLQHGELMSSLNLDKYYHVYDLIPFKYPEFMWDDNAPKKHLNRLCAVAKCGAQIIVMSEYVKNDINIVLTQLQIQTPDMVVINPGTEEVFTGSSIHERGVFNPIPKFTIVSTIDRRKNHLLLLNIWRELIEVYGEDAPELHIIGKRGTGSTAVSNMIERSPALQSKVKEHEGLKDEEIVAHLLESRAALFPSFDEGWGLPIVESLSMGIPVICSDIPVHRECSQGYATFISPIDGIGWKNAILKIISESRSDWVTRVENTKGFIPIRWSDSTRKMNSYIKTGYL